MIIHSKQVIEEGDTKVCALPKCSMNDSWCLGLITMEQTFTMFGYSQTFAFLHLTLQEFLAAYHMAHHKDNGSRILHEHGHHKYMSNVLMFYCGMTTFIENDARFDMLVRSCMLCDNLLHCVYESQQRTFCDQIVDHISWLYIVGDKYISQKTITELLYVITKRKKRFFNLCIENCQVDKERLTNFINDFRQAKDFYNWGKIFQYPISFARGLHHCTLSFLKELNLSVNSLGSDGVLVL